MRGTAILLFALARSALASASENPAKKWVQERAEEHRAYLTSGSTPDAGTSGSGQALWRELGPEAPPIAGFNPPTSLAPLIRAVRKGVVNISASQGAVGARRSLGSGFILGPDGYVVTNHHVIHGAREIRVRLADGREFGATVVGKDPSTDVALLRLRGDGMGELPFAYLGDSDQLEVGEWVVAIGNPFGLDHSVAHGMISAKERVIGMGVFDDFIQTDALINPGNSGGPLYNMRGEVIGVNTAVVSRGQGIGFAVPINMVKDLLPNLLRNGRLARGWLGVNIQEGAVVKDVFKNSPAARAGILAGDRVIAVNGRPIESYLQLLRRIAILAPGNEAKLTIQRHGKPQELVVKLTERPAPDALQAVSQSRRPDALGLIVDELKPETAQALGVPPYSGVMVSGVVPGSAAERAELTAGDVITEVNRRKVTDLKTFQNATERQTADGSTLIRYRRGDAERYVAVRPGE